MPPVTPPLSLEQRIKVTFKGFFIAHVEDASSSAQIYALASSPCHSPKIHVYRVDKSSDVTTEIRSDPQGHPIDPSLDCSLESDKSSPSIHKFWTRLDPLFDRSDPYNNPRDFRWFVNLNEVHNLSGSGTDQVDLKPGARLAPIFRIYDGVFHADDVAAVEFRRFHVEEPGSPDDHFGKLAFEITARIYLSGNETATFKNGQYEIFTANSEQVNQYVFDIEYDCRCLTNEGDGDFHLIYDAISLPHGTKKVDLKPDFRGEAADRRELINPEVYCTGGTFP